ncbi:MAG TPA: hypothetical protein VMX12_05795 [Acidimicrobiia bacterium]|nr:hypothetical protein [Acidimicrobiia bacterium]
MRILNGDWRRALSNSATKILSVRSGGGHCGIFLDPPYSTEAERAHLYTEEDFDVAHDVRRWCIEHGDDPMLRIVLAGYDVEHVELESHGWRAVEWYRAGFLRGGMGNTTKAGSTSQQKRERLWMSPACLGAEEPRQGGLFG